MSEYDVTVRVSADSPEDAMAVVIVALGTDKDAINDIGGLKVSPVLEEKQYLVCDNCGEAFDDIIPAYEHGTADLSGSAGWCGDNGFSIVPESEAL